METIKTLSSKVLCLALVGTMSGCGAVDAATDVVYLGVDTVNGAVSIVHNVADAANAVKEMAN